MRVVRILALLAAVLLFACAGQREEAYRPRGTPPSPPAKKSAEAADEARSAQEPMAKASAEEEAVPAPSSAAADSATSTWTPASIPQLPEKRARIYSGFCRLIVEEMERAKKELERLAQERGGYVESIVGQKVILRLPAERFQESFAYILGLGEVVHKAVETYDVSDTLRDQEARLRLAERARQRLYELLEKATDAGERLEILREIKRLSEEIEQIRLSLELLKSQIALSRITVELVPRLAETPVGREAIPFPWIANLDPLYPSLTSLKGRVSLALGDEFAVFERQKSYRAESPEGTRVRLGSTLNLPKGDGAFWQKALAHHLGPLYRSSEPIGAGPFRGALFTSKDSKPYFYLVGVSVKEKSLYVLEAFFPDQEARQKRLAAVTTAMQEFKTK